MSFYQRRWDEVQTVGDLQATARETHLLQEMIVHPSPYETKSLKFDQPLTRAQNTVEKVLIVAIMSLWVRATFVIDEMGQTLKHQSPPYML